MAWKQTLLAASFKGVGFEVSDDSLSARHALSNHAYPYVVGADIEDMGAEELAFRLNIVYWGDDYESRLQQLLKVLQELGSGELIHPIYGSVPDCVVADYDVTHTHEEADACRISVTFVQSVAGAPFFERELPLSLADKVDWLADLANWEGFALFESVLGTIQSAQQRWNAFHALVLGTVSTLWGQVGGVFSGVLNLINSPKVLVLELQSIWGSMKNTRNVVNGSVASWRDLLGGQKNMVKTVYKTAKGTATVGDALGVDVAEKDVAVLMTMVATTTACALAEEAADVFAMQLQSPILTPSEIELMLADVHGLLMQVLAANRIVALMLANPKQADDLAYYIINLFHDDADNLNDVYTRIEAAGLLPNQTYLPTTTAISDQIRDLAFQLQKQALAVIELKPPLIQRTVEADGRLHLIAWRWYGDFARETELLRLNPDIEHPNQIERGRVLYAYAR